MAPAPRHKNNRFSARLQGKWVGITVLAVAVLLLVALSLNFLNAGPEPSPNAPGELPAHDLAFAQVSPRSDWHEYVNFANELRINYPLELNVRDVDARASSTSTTTTIAEFYTKSAIEQRVSIYLRKTLVDPDETIRDWLEQIKREPATSALNIPLDVPWNRPNSDVSYQLVYDLVKSECAGEADCMNTLYRNLSFKSGNYIYTLECKSCQEQMFSVLADMFATFRTTSTLTSAENPYDPKAEELKQDEITWGNGTKNLSEKMVLKYPRSWIGRTSLSTQHVSLDQQQLEDFVYVSGYRLGASDNDASTPYRDEIDLGFSLCEFKDFTSCMRSFYPGGTPLSDAELEIAHGGVFERIDTADVEAVIWGKDVAEREEELPKTILIYVRSKKNGAIFNLSATFPSKQVAWDYYYPRIKKVVESIRFE